jgi:hypothetical protein
MRKLLDVFGRVAVVAMALCLGVIVQVAWVSPPAAAATGDRIVVERSVDPDGFLLNRAVPRSAADLPPVCVGARDVHPFVGPATLEVTNGCPAPQRVERPRTGAGANRVPLGKDHQEMI